MDKTPISFETAIRKWAEERRRGLADALPDPEEMVGYRAGKLEPDAEAALQERLALHPAAARELLDLASFERLQPPDEQHRLSEADVEEALVAMRARIRLEDEKQDIRQGGLEEPVVDEPQAEIIQFPAKRLRTLRATVRISAMAALLAIVVGASWIGALYRKLEEAAGPRYATVIDVETTRGARPYAASPDAERILLVIHGVDLRSFARGRLEISTDGGEVLRQHDFTASEDEASLLTLDLPRDVLPDGTYRVEVFGLDSEGRHPLKEYRFGLEDSVSSR